MKSRNISNEQITASSFWQSWGVFGILWLQPWKGRLDNDANWATAERNTSDPWIQVDLLQPTLVTGIMTQGSALYKHIWVTYLQVQYGDSIDSLVYITETNQTKVSTFERF